MNMQSSNQARLPRRPYGKDGEELSIVGFGGIVVKNSEPAQAARVVADAVEKGVCYFDVAPGYGDAEEKLGPALKPYRKDVFLACKTNKRSKAEAEESLNTSLERLRTDYLDLFQFHGLGGRENDLETVFAKDGALAAMIEAKESGRVRHLGFSCHKEEIALAALDLYDFDSVLFPINFACMLRAGMGRELLKRAQEKGVTVMAIKAMARQQWESKEHPLRQTYPKPWYEPLLDPELMELALRFTLSQPIAAAIPPGEESLFRQALDFGLRFQPIGDAEVERLKHEAQDLDYLFQ